MLVDAERKGVGVLEGLVDDADDAAIAAVTVAELVVGAELADGERRAAREAFLAEVLKAVSVEDYDLDVAREHGALLAHARRSGRPRGAHDLIIAATARARRREVVSADLDGFADLPEVTLRRVAD
ncbi:MAG: type toxin-antitoxin system VapC family toxin [Solirubrobacterales bacterium]|nr:type toxin-antitoxin system VapC family toxin [Solirubrobacterales bacterium]